MNAIKLDDLIWTYGEWRIGRYGRDNELDLKPGMLLKMQNGDVLLVGHINDQSGLCDDCTLDAVVVAHATLPIAGLSDGVRV